MSKSDQWISGINAVASALEHDIEHVREVLVEAGNKNARITEIEENARRERLEALIDREGRDRLRQQLAQMGGDSLHAFRSPVG